MGSPKQDGTTSRGKYIYISKEFMGVFFPPLSTTVLNDSVLLPIIPPFNNTKVYSRFVYHNDKFFTRPANSGSPRNECRVYLNRDIDPDKSFYEPEDIAVFEKLEIEGEVMPVYLMHRFAPNDENYVVLRNVIAESSVRNHALVKDLQFFNKEVSEERFEQAEVIIAEDAKNEIIKQQEEILSLEEVGDEFETVSGAHLFNSTNFRDFVLLGYGYKCAITKKVINWNEFYNLEAAHIKPKAQAGTFLPCNGIALSRDMHWAFDKGFLTISDDLKVIVHDEVKHTFLADFDGEEIIIPTVSYFQSEQRFLQYHRENIFGLFKHSGVIRRL